MVAMSPRTTPTTARRYVLVPARPADRPEPELRRLRLARVDGEPPPRVADAPFDYLKRTYD
jgi:hypothetical protein